MELVARVLGEREDSRPRMREASFSLHWLGPNETTFGALATPGSARMRGVAVEVIRNEELLAEASGSRSTRGITLDSSTLPGRYAPGDHLAVYPVNPMDSVEYLCGRLGVLPDARFEVARGTCPTTGRTAREVLSRELSLGLQEPFEDLLETMALLATDDEERHRLESMLEQLGYGGQNAASVVDELPSRYVDLPALLDDFQSVALTLPHLIDLLPPLKPRLYSISSSPRLSPHEIRLTVGVVEVVTPSGQRRPGLCSHYLAELEPGDLVHVELRRSDFRLPEDTRAPLVLVGPGTGISPLIGFLEERQALQRAGAELGPAWLWFGCRNQGDYLYRDTLEAWLDTEVLTELDVAFSRHGRDKVYVQHLMQTRAEELWEVLSQPDCHVCICGDAKMGDDVFDTFISIAMGVGRLSREAANEMFAAMKRQRRYQADVWGVTLHVAATTEAMKEAVHERTGRFMERARPETRLLVAATLP
jgi:sulfite reductase alpha subunit-like flavoprotein